MPTVKEFRREKIKRGVRKKVSGTPERPRVAIFKSNKYLYAQIIDDTTGTTLVSASSLEIAKDKNTNVEISKELGKALAEKALAKGITNTVFDRSGYLYHGKVKALADGAREGGLKL